MKTVNHCRCFYCLLDFFRSGFVAVCLAHELLFNLFYSMTSRCATRLTGIWIRCHVFCNRYVKVYLLPDKSKSGKRKTKVKKHTLNPVFDETLKVSLQVEDQFTIFGYGNFHRRLCKWSKDDVMRDREKLYCLMFQSMKFSWMMHKNPAPSSQRTQSVSITKMNELMLFGEKKLLFILRITRNTKIHSVDRMQSFVTLKLLVRIFTTVFYTLNYVIFHMLSYP